MKLLQKISGSMEKIAGYLLQVLVVLCLFFLWVWVMLFSKTVPEKSQ